LKLVLTGQKVVPRFVVDFLSEARVTPPPVFSELSGSMTGREHQILHMVVKGASNKAIGLALGISEPTVKFYVKALMRKVQAANRTQIAVWALANGYGLEGPGAAKTSLASTPSSHQSPETDPLSRQKAVSMEGRDLRGEDKGRSQVDTALQPGRPARDRGADAMRVGSYAALGLI
jgi:DNA-binding CsgD family transcriptional regulator